MLARSPPMIIVIYIIIVMVQLTHCKITYSEKRSIVRTVTVIPSTVVSVSRKEYDELPKRDIPKNIAPHEIRTATVLNTYCPALIFLSFVIFPFVFLLQLMNDIICIGKEIMIAYRKLDIRPIVK